MNFIGADVEVLVVKQCIETRSGRISILNPYFDEFIIRNFIIVIVKIISLIKL